MTIPVLHSFVNGWLLQGSMSSSSQPSPGPWPDINTPIIDWARAWCARGHHPKPFKPKNKAWRAHCVSVAYGW
jgi:hypothetical protein